MLSSYMHVEISFVLYMQQNAFFIYDNALSFDALSQHLLCSIGKSEQYNKYILISFSSFNIIYTTYTVHHTIHIICFGFCYKYTKLHNSTYNLPHNWGPSSIVGAIYWAVLLSVQLSKPICFTLMQQNQGMRLYLDNAQINVLLL